MPPTPKVHVARPSGLLVAFDPPELTMDAAIRRGWEMDDDDLLMVPKRDEKWMQTFSATRAILNWYEHEWKFHADAS